MDENPHGWSGPEELRDWLTSKGIPVHKWGTGEAKRVEDLLDELGTGESVLIDTAVERRVSFVSVVIRRGDKVLMEVAQVLANGTTRERNWPPGEKMHPGEKPGEAALRCMEEELQVPPELCRIVPDSITREDKLKESPSYPLLITRYVAYQVEMEVSNFREEERFETPESGDSAVVKHIWEWRPATEL